MCFECGEDYDVDSIEKSDNFKCPSCGTQYGLVDVATNPFLDSGSDRIEAVANFMRDIMKLEVNEK